MTELYGLQEILRQRGMAIIILPGATEPDMEMRLCYANGRRVFADYWLVRVFLSGFTDAAALPRLIKGLLQRWERKNVPDNA